VSVRIYGRHLQLRLLMKKHVKNYMKAYGYGEQDIIVCEKCPKIAVDIHHIQNKSQGGTDEVDNLIALCRKCHRKAHNLT